MTSPNMADTQEDRPPELSTIVTRIAATIDAERFPSADRPALRRLQPDFAPSLAFYRFACKHLPPNWEDRRDAWMTLAAGMALMCPQPHRPDRAAGLALAEAGYSEKRLEQLLASEDDTLRALLLRAARFLAAKKTSCNWLHFARLLLAHEPEEQEAARLAIARDYYYQNNKN